MNVLIVESPSKAKSINKYLGSSFKVLASIGHVRDLSPKNDAIDTENNFNMKWETSERGKKIIKDITEAAKNSENLYLATDPDREGEAIAWHIENLLRENSKLENLNIQRITFNEITKDAVLEALKEPRKINENLVNAYLARRVLDFLVGFNLSPVLWRKLPGSKSAGRVQSVALKIITTRELEIEKFQPHEYWSVNGFFNKGDDKKFEARLIKYDGNKIEKLTIKDEQFASEILNAIQECTFTINRIEKKETKRNPYPPFTTSSMQIEASRKLGFSANHTMRTAQRLYEGIEIDGEPIGLITYMRTDSVIMSKTAISEVRSYVEENIGKVYLPKEPRIYKSKTKNAQEAHECVRPTNISLSPEKIKKYLIQDEFKLYEIIWQRAVSSQMANAIINQVAVDIEDSNHNMMFRANGSSIKFKGMLAVYNEAKDEDEENNKDSKDLPELNEKDNLNMIDSEKKQHFTLPPPRYTEASLVKKLEELGIGRPSTYASIIKVLQDRDYVILDKKRFIPHDRGRVVSIFLENFFNKYVEYDFTADLENQLDEISDGKLDWKNVIQKFWETFKVLCDQTIGKANREIIDVIDNALGPHFFPPDGEDKNRKCPTCDNGRLGLKVGKFGGFVGCSNYPDCKYTVQFNQLNDSNNGTLAGPKEIGVYPETGEMITLRKGPYGFYIQVGEGTKEKKPKRVSIPKNFEPEEIGLNTTIQLLGLPRKLGFHPETNKTVSAGIGMYGPYILHDKKYKALEKTDNILDIELERAIELIAKPTIRGNATLKNFGEHPEERKEITAYDGKYGPYVKCGKINASLLGDQTIDNINLEDAIKLINERKIKIGQKTKKKTIKKNTE
ncbi:MAG: type I DNA topoisomerase [Pelagibacteraceae bacterium]|jgi:DNA topoisomerase-1|nr:type I DNA topoisomerase [Pelagibacteraceae bacterium]HJO13922.1 type I DNA topoisomerase [Alphaproteobacteria bacterium]MBO6468101.1 type I DNA topoisomerase [Pelagibacteraceae bacterium]MBO6469543.1 type I DNA topoisomerase [Pelagibacteraceae bacterium]MBO6471026.1 type I DNA topoisomerase [Pelagibacteraceae bacterium]